MGDVGRDVFDGLCFLETGAPRRRGGGGWGGWSWRAGGGGAFAIAVGPGKDGLDGGNETPGNAIETTARVQSHDRIV